MAIWKTLFVLINRSLNGYNFIYRRTIKNLSKKKAGFTQVELSELTGLDRSYIANVEAGKRNITVVNLEKMLSPLNTDFSTFFLCINQRRN